MDREAMNQEVRAFFAKARALGVEKQTMVGVLNRLEEVTKQRDELLAAAESIEINAEECLDFDECTAMLLPIDDYHKLVEAIASMKGGAA